jgi:hypothetical protein
MSNDWKDLTDSQIEHCTKCLATLSKHGITGETEAELTKKWRMFALKNHPDKGGDAELFKTVNDCYDHVIKQKTCPSKPRPAPKKYTTRKTPKETASDEEPKPKKTTKRKPAAEKPKKAKKTDKTPKKPRTEKKKTKKPKTEKAKKTEKTPKKPRTEKKAKPAAEKPKKAKTEKTPKSGRKTSEKSKKQFANKVSKNECKKPRIAPSVSVLRKLASEQKVEGRSTMSKAQLCKTVKVTKKQWKNLAAKKPLNAKN